jgi:deoxycytidylate deaminase
LQLKSSTFRITTAKIHQQKPTIKMKTNNYLSLCREQAALSSLHYRHGCVIVRGGKVVGQGFNDSRAGFDGGALKHGRIASGGLDGPAILDLKRKRKLKPKPEPSSSVNNNSKSFTPYESMGGGHRANVPLSMHSEMMAIHSAIARSSTLTATAVSSVKPSFKLPGSSKRKTRLRQEALKAYVKLVCCAALEQQQQHGEKQSDAERREGKSSVQQWCFEASASQSGQGGGIRAGGKTSWSEEGEEPLLDEERAEVSVSVRPFWTTEGTVCA